MGGYFLLIPLILVESVWMVLRKIELELLTWQVCKITLRRTSIIKYLRVLQTFLCLKNYTIAEPRSPFLAFRFWKYSLRIFWVSSVSVVVFPCLSLTLFIWIFSPPPFSFFSLVGPRACQSFFVVDVSCFLTIGKCWLLRAGESFPGKSKPIYCLIPNFQPWKYK